MNAKIRISALVAMAITASAMLGGFALVRAQQPPAEALHEDEHDHENEDSHGDEPSPAPDEHDHGAETSPDDAHADHGDEPVVRLSDQEIARWGIQLMSARPGSIATRIRLPGQIVLNADRVAHVVPRAPGIVREVLKTVGDEVHAGEVMAWIESAELGEAKVDYLSKRAEVGCCTFDLTRAQEVNDNSTRLLELLKSTPSLEVLQDMNGVPMGENRSELISAFAELKFAEAAYRREGQLLEKKVSSERDFQAVEAEYKKADALYAAKRDSIQFKVKRNLAEAKRTQRIREIELRGAARRLYVHGLTAEDIKELELLGQDEVAVDTGECGCGDPDCKGCAEGNDAAPARDEQSKRAIEEKLAWYPLRAPFDGTVIEKHLTLGEKHGDDASAFTLADLSDVWVDISVYQRDLAHIVKGQLVRISTGPGGAHAEGVIAYVAAIVDEHTRTALARVVLPNPDGRWRPGSFVNGEIHLDGETASILVPKSAVQRIEGVPSVFVQMEDEFEPVPVELGQSDSVNVEIVAGLVAGQRYVAEGAFELKAKLVTSGMGAHAGHGH